MFDEEFEDNGEPWIEVDSETLGFPSFHSNTSDSITRLLSEAQARFETPPSPPPSRDGDTTDVSGYHERISMEELLAAAASKAAACGKLSENRQNHQLVGADEWPSRPDISHYSINTEFSDDSNGPSFDSASSWSLRSSPAFRSSFTAWILDHIPLLLSHTTTFLLGAAA